MSENELTLVDAIQMALESEKKAVAAYSDAAKNAPHKALEGLFNNLASYEQHHYDKLAELALSLAKKGKYVVYERCPVSIPPQSEVAGVTKDVLTGSQVSLMDVLTSAQDIEKQFDKQYTAMAAQTSDRDGKEMFEWLAKEERGHLELLTDVYWNLNDRGVLAWPGL
jgi:rubrerythrin